MILRRTILFFLTGIIVAATSSFDLPTQPDSQEYVLKAAFLYRFTDYVEWSNNNDDADFNIVVLGDSKITDPLNEIAKEKKIKGKNMTVRVCQDINSIGNCQVVFVSNTFHPGIDPVIAKIGDRSVLIIAEQKDACEKGAQINFLLSEDKLKFEINMKAASKAGLRISSELLQHAILINP